MLSDDLLLVLVALHLYDGAGGRGVGREEDVVLAGDAKRDCGSGVVSRVLCLRRWCWCTRLPWCAVWGRRRGKVAVRASDEAMRATRACLLPGGWNELESACDALVHSLALSVSLRAVSGGSDSISACRSRLASLSSLSLFPARSSRSNLRQIWRTLSARAHLRL